MGWLLTIRGFFEGFEEALPVAVKQSGRIAAWLWVFAICGGCFLLVLYLALLLMQGVGKLLGWS